MDPTPSKEPEKTTSEPKETASEPKETASEPKETTSEPASSEPASSESAASESAASSGGKRRTKKRRTGRKPNKYLKAWVAFVGKVKREEKIAKYTDAIRRAKERKDKGEKWMGGAGCAALTPVSGGRKQSRKQSRKQRR